MKRKFIYTILIVICISVFFMGCNNVSANNAVAEQEEQEPESLVLISRSIVEGSNIESAIMYDPDTLVMYIYVLVGDRAATTSGFSVMLNSDGSPKLYKTSTEY